MQMGHILTSVACDLPKRIVGCAAFGHFPGLYLRRALDPVCIILGPDAEVV